MSQILAGAVIFAGVVVSAASSAFNIAIDSKFAGSNLSSSSQNTSAGADMGSAILSAPSAGSNLPLIRVAASGKMAPETIQQSDVTLILESIGRVGAIVQTDKRNRSNLTSPVLVDGNLYIADQLGGAVFRFDEAVAGGVATEVFNVRSRPPDNLRFKGKASILNIADGPGDTVYIAFTAQDVPPEVVPEPLPEDDRYLLHRMNYQVIYKYEMNPFDGTEGEPAPILLAAFEQVPGHRGGGLLTLPNGDLLFARGDNLGFNRDGLSYAQDHNFTMSKLLIIDQKNGAVKLAAKGVRNVQHLTYVDDEKSMIAFADIGAAVADEINVISVAALMDPSEIENFGWGRIPGDASDGDGADGTAREGMYYINGGHTDSPKTVPIPLGEAPLGEKGFIQPYAQAGSEGAKLFALSGPVYSDRYFTTIETLFGDLVSGDLYGTFRNDSSEIKSVYRVNLKDPSGAQVDLLAEANSIGLDRVDVRFFSFADGQPGLLTEQTGEIYRLTETTN